MLAWVSNTIPGPAAKKAAAIAMVNAMGNIGSIPGSYIWPAKYGPLYVKSFGAEIAILGTACVFAFVLSMYLRYLNKKLDREEGVAIVPLEGTAKSESVEESASADLGGGPKGFRYLY
jgi:hypothetical protein